MTKYVLGFMFSLDKSQVLLIEKNHPEWQKGKLNGIGGKIKSRELEEYAIVREFKEETGLDTSIYNWELFAVLNGNDNDKEKSNFICYCYKCFSDVLYEAKTIEDEIVIGFNLKNLMVMNENQMIQNLKYLIPLALTTETNLNIVNFNYAKENI